MLSHPCQQQHREADDATTPTTATTMRGVGRAGERATNTARLSQSGPAQGRIADHMSAAGSRSAAGSHARVPTSVLPSRWRPLFPYSHLNAMQSECFDAAFGSDDSVVISSPTGSGKTAVLELALARLFATPQTGPNRSLAVYMAPLKALTHERLLDWQPKLGGLGVSIVELTGDSADEANDERAVARADLIVTTPEKWDSFSRFRRDAQGVMGRVALLLVDEIHLLVDPSRGPTLETVISRMRTISQAHEVRGMPIASLRVLAASATISNVEDIAAWLGR